MPQTIRLINPNEIQHALDQIWESLETANTTRACLFNLILYTKKNYRTGYIQKLSQAVIEKFPARVIFIIVDSSSQEEKLTTQVSILNSSKGEYDVACDFIQLEATKATQIKIPFIILPHILPDLPIYLLLEEDPSHEDPLTNALEKFANRLIFDSESTNDLAHFAFSALQHHQTTHTDIADLNWARIESWREMLSSTFYSNDRLDQLKQTQNIEISYNAHSSTYFCHTRIQSLYLQAWLASQLGWTLKKISTQNDRLSIDYDTMHSPLTVTLIPISSADLPPGLILNMDLMTIDKTHFAFQCDLHSIHQVTLKISTPDQCEMPCKYIFAKAESGHSLVKEICHRGTSQHFLNVLDLIQKMKGEGLC